MTPPAGSDAGSTDLVDRIGARLDATDAPIRWPDDYGRMLMLVGILLEGHGWDIGCSDGGLICRWLANNHRATALLRDVRDTEEVVLRTATRFGVRDRVTFLCSQMPTKHPPPDMKKLDWVTMCEVLEHLTPRKADAMLDSVLERCRRDAHVIITVPNRFPLAGIVRERWSFEDHRQFFTHESLELWLQRRFRTVRVTDIVDGIWLLAQCRT